MNEPEKVNHRNGLCRPSTSAHFVDLHYFFCLGGYALTLNIQRHLRNDFILYFVLLWCDIAWRNVWYHKFMVEVITFFTWILSETNLTQESSCLLICHQAAWPHRVLVDSHLIFLDLPSSFGQFAAGWAFNFRSCSLIIHVWRFECLNFFMLSIPSLASSPLGQLQIRLAGLGGL